MVVVGTTVVGGAALVTTGVRALAGAATELELDNPPADEHEATKVTKLSTTAQKVVRCRAGKVTRTSYFLKICCGWGTVTVPYPQQIRFESRAELPTGTANSNLLLSPGPNMADTSPFPLKRAVILAAVLSAIAWIAIPASPSIAVAESRNDSYGCDPALSPGRDVIVRNNDELSNAVRNRQSGDDIQIATNRRLRAISMNEGTAGNADNWITVRAASGFNPRIRARGHLGVDVRVPYVQICDLEVAGRSRARRVDDITRTGILVLDTHHVRIANNNVHNFSVGGIAVNHSNNIEIVGNEVARNSFWGVEQGSGISVFKPNRNRGDFKGRYQIVIAGNRSHHNRNRVVKPQVGKATDGNGIILDDFRNVFPGGHGEWRGTVLVANNVVYRNGGRGIHGAPNGGVRVHIINNTAYHNMQSLGDASVPYDSWAEAEISVAGTLNKTSKKVKVVNNIAIADPSIAGAMAFFRNNIGDNTLVEHHNSFSGPAIRDFYLYPGIHHANGNHRLGAGSTTSASVDFVNAGRGDFRLAQPVAAGSNGWNRRIAAQDIEGVSRPRGEFQERGAHEFG